MSTENDDHDGGEWDDPSDLTRIEDLSEFLHEEDPEVEARLAAAQGDSDSLPDLPNEGEDLLGLDDLDDDDDQNFDQEDSFNNSSDNSDDFNSDEDSSENLESEETAFSEEQTNPNFEAPDLPSDEDQDSGDSWEDSDSSFDSEGDSFEASAIDSEDSLDVSDEDVSDEQDSDSWDNNDSSDFSSDYDDESESENDGENFESLDANGDDFSTVDEEEDDDSFESFDQNQNDDDQGDYDDLEDQTQNDDDDDEDSYAPSDFELPEPTDINSNPPIQAAVSTSDGAIQSPQRENFQDLRDFGNAITYGVVTTGGNPPFSLILRNIKFEEDAEDIKILLREHGLVTDDNEETITQGLEQGSLLISQISEYSAIFLAHKLRRFDVELRIGLSDQLHPSKSYSREGRGLVSKYNLRQNHRESLMDLNTDIDVEDIKMSTTPTLDGYNIHRYIDVITSHTLIEEEELKRLHNINLSDSSDEEQDVVLGELLDQFPSDENTDSDALQFDLGLNEIYKELVVELRNEAFKIEANGVVGINFNITPLMMRSGNTANIHYKITCSGNAVWIVDQQI